jgi:DNA-binding beta-propeller fold protein YncE
MPISKQMKIILWLPVLALISLMTGCVKDKPDDPATPPPVITGRKMYIANEGSLGNGNATLSVFNIDKDSIYNDVYALKNGQPLGDIFQSMTIAGDRLFLAVNNSDKVAVISKQDFSLIGNIAVRKPRYMLLVNEEKMYVSSLYYPEINIVNPKTLQVTGKINIDYPNAEGMAFLNGKVYACNWDTACNYLYEINPQTDAITARIPLAGRAPQQVVADKEQKLWVLSGNVYKQKKASLTRIDPADHTILKSYVFPDGADIMKPVWNPGKDTLYFLGGKL